MNNSLLIADLIRDKLSVLLTTLTIIIKVRLQSACTTVISMDVTINEDVLEKHLKDILPTVDASTVTIKTISEMIRKRLDASQEDLVAWKPALKALIPKMLDWCQNQSNTQPDEIDDKVINASYLESDEALESQSDYSGSEVDRKQVMDLIRIL